MCYFLSNIWINWVFHQPKYQTVDSKKLASLLIMLKSKLLIGCLIVFVSPQFSVQRSVRVERSLIFSVWFEFSYIIDHFKTLSNSDFFLDYKKNHWLVTLVNDFFKVFSIKGDIENIPMHFHKYQNQISM